MKNITRLCRQLHLCDVTSEYKAIYSPFEHGIAFLPNSIWKKISENNYQDIPNNVLQYLKEMNILVEEGFEDSWIKYNYPVEDRCFNSMYLITSLACNLQCKYCVVFGPDYQNVMSQNIYMEKGIAEAALYKFLDHLNKTKPLDARITFYGGEPLLNKQLLFDIVPIIAESSYDYENPKKIEMIVITNGYNYDEKLTDLFKKFNVGVCVSLDGKQQHHDKARVEADKRTGTYSRILKNFQMYKQSGINMGISLTIGKHNYKDLPAIGIFFVKDLNTKFIECQIPYQPSEGKNLFWVSSYDFADYLFKTYSSLKKIGAIEGTTHRRYRDIIARKIRYRDCGASSSQLVVTPDGKMGPCHSLSASSKFFEGSVTTDKDPSDMDTFKEWSTRHPFNMPECHKCPYLTICGGGCIYNALVSSGTIWKKDPQVCSLMEKFIDFCLVEIWNDHNTTIQDFQTKGSVCKE